MGDADANIDQLCDNVVNSFKSVVKNISPVIQNLAKTIPNAMEGILDAISPLIPEFLELGVNLFEALVKRYHRYAAGIEQHGGGTVNDADYRASWRRCRLVVEAAAQLLSRAL